MFLPASDYNLRSNEFSPDPRMGLAGVPSSVPAMAARILDRELAFISRRRDCRFALASVSATDINRAYSEIARGRQDIAMPDLIWFLDTNGFQPKTEDLEAILRRCDHDADRMISLEEFAETLGYSFESLRQERGAAYESIRIDREMKLE